MANTDYELVRLGHLVLDGMPVGDNDPENQIPFAQVDVTVTDNCRVAPKTVAV